MLVGSLWVMAIAATAQPSAAQVSTAFAATADSYTDASRPDNNYSSRTTLRTDGDPVIDAFIRFDVQGVGAVPSSTTLSWAST